MESRASARKVSANRRNAQKSTGPRTQKGKERSRMNALGHGLLVKEIRNSAPFLGESPRDVDNLFQYFVDELHPVGPIELLQVELITAAYWKLLRLERAEAGRIAARYQQPEVERTPDKLEQDFYDLPEPASDGISDSTSESRRLDRDEAQQICRRAIVIAVEISERFNPLIVLDAIREEFEYASIATVALGFELADVECLDVWQILDSPSEPDDKERKIEEHLKQAALSPTHLAYSEERERIRGLAEAHTPTKEDMETLVRYDVKIRRDLRTAISDLEQRQRRRKGEFEPREPS